MGRSLLDAQVLETARRGYRRFIDTTLRSGTDVALTTLAEPTAYARCFAIFGLRLLREDETLAARGEAWARAIRTDLDALRAERLRDGAVLSFDKPYLQLLTFSLSALSALERLAEDPLSEHVEPLLSRDVPGDLQRSGALHGKARSGNQAMFMAILMLHAGKYLGREVTDGLAQWQDLHLKAMNGLGFWGSDTSMSHLQFQNGYHQYEIFEYLDTPEVPWTRAAKGVAGLADADGHFAPYPGGGGCYDYDAVFILTADADAAQEHRALLTRTAHSILSEQNADGGFGESQRIRPRSLENLGRSLRHVLAGRGRARTERLRQALTLLRPRHNEIHTHWSVYSRQWGESDLWDSWFRMLAIARIECAFEPARCANWGFIDFPGIGFHPSLHAEVLR